MDDKQLHPNRARSGVLKAMDTARTDTQSKMMATALDMIGKQANLNFTIREFAKRAGVNLASVNYYFRSKENLISEIESLLKSQLQKTYEELKRSEFDPRTRILRWAERLMHQLMEYPGVLFLMVTKLITDGRQNLGITELIDNSEEMLAPIITDLTGIDEDDPRCSYIIMQIVAGVVTPILFYHGVGRTFGINVSDPDVRQEYIESLVDAILPAID